MSNLKTTFALKDAFEETGRWWLPDTPDRRIAGTLKYAPDEITLTLHGALVDIPLNERGQMATEHRRVTHIYGSLDNGRSCSLLNVVEGEYHASPIDGTTRQGYSAIYLVIGSHTPDLDSLRIRSVSFTCDHLDDFAGGRYFQLLSPTETQHLTIVHHQPEPLRYPIASLNAELAFRVDAHFSATWTTATITSALCIDLIPSDPQDVLWYVARLHSFCELLTLLTDDVVFPTTIRFSLDDGALFDGWLLYRAIAPTSDSQPPSPYPLFLLGHLKDDFGSMLEKWFSANKTFVNAIHLFTNARNDVGSHADRFLNATKALEAFSRATVPSLYIAEDNFTALYRTIIAAIPPDTDEDLRHSIERRMYFANQYAFRKRITLLLRSLSPKSLDLVCKKIADFVHGITDTRNYLTHYSDDPDTIPLDYTDRYWAYQKMVMLLRFVLMKELGIDEDLVVDRILEHAWLAQRRALWLQCREFALPPESD